jgi:hypothetical protein
MLGERRAGPVERFAGVLRIGQGGVLAFRRLQSLSGFGRLRVEPRACFGEALLLQGLPIRLVAQLPLDLRGAI